MSFDSSRIRDVVNSLWDAYGPALIVSAAVLVVALVVIAAVIVVRSRQRDRLVAALTALVVLAWTSEGLWEVARFKIGLPLAFAAMTFFVYEAMMFTCALQAERYRRRHPSPGPAGRYVWVLAGTTATIVAFNASSLVEAMLRFTLPLAAAGLWWIGVTAEREDDSEHIKQLRETERQRREATWAISWRQLLVAVGVMRPSKQTLSDAERERRVRQMVTAADTLQVARPGSWRAGRAQKRLRKLARLATANDVTTVRARVARATHIVELVMPSAEPPTADGDGASAVHSGNSHVSGPGSPVPRPADDSSTEPGAGRLGGTAPFHPETHGAVPRNGTVPAESNPQVDSHDGGRAAAERVFRDSVRAGHPLSARQVAKRVGCSPTTAWRGIRVAKQTSGAESPSGADPSPNGSSSDADVLINA